MRSWARGPMKMRRAQSSAPMQQQLGDRDGGEENDDAHSMISKSMLSYRSLMLLTQASSSIRSSTE